MEERTPPPPPPPPPPPSALETYIVQIPRDQIYRVPPPEHALIIEEHKRRTALHQDNHRRSFLWAYVLPAVALLALAGIAFLAVRAALYSPATPEFAVASFRGNRARQPEFEVLIEATNRNPRLAVSYKEGGAATLALQGRVIGKGKTAAAAGGDDIVVALGGEAAATSKEMERMMNDEKEKALELKVDGVMVEMKSWLRIESFNLKISCQFRVINSLMNDSQISFQQCKTES